jgi:hypothetical protein
VAIERYLLKSAVAKRDEKRAILKLEPIAGNEQRL